MTVAATAGFDLGGTQLKYGLIDEKGALLFKSNTPTPPTIDGLIDLIAGIWKDLRARSAGPVEAAGFGIPGIYDFRRRKILQSPNFPELDEFDLHPALARVVDAPFWVDNDANMAAFGEWAHGAGRRVSSLILLTVGTGIGGGIILAGRLWQGSCGYAGEVGHIIVNPDGEMCNCGNQGCLEAEASATAIVRSYGKQAGTAESVTAEDIYHRAKAGDAAALHAFARAGHYLGIGLGILINLLNPEKILLGGGVMTTGEFLLEPAVAEARKRSYKASFGCCAIEKASLGNDAGLIGSAAWAHQNLAADRARG
jgi:glucokinase